MKTPLPLHERLVDPKTGKISNTSTWVSILKSAQTPEEVAAQFKTLLASVSVVNGKLTIKE
jgi:hypothetical protein